MRELRPLTHPMNSSHQEPKYVHNRSIVCYSPTHSSHPIKDKRVGSSNMNFTAPWYNFLFSSKIQFMVNLRILIVRMLEEIVILWPTLYYLLNTSAHVLTLKCEIKEFPPWHNTDNLLRYSEFTPKYWITAAQREGSDPISYSWIYFAKTFFPEFCEKKCSMLSLE